MKRTTTINQCQQCGVDFSGPNWEMKNRKFCSRSCAQTFNNNIRYQDRKADPTLYNWGIRSNLYYDSLVVDAIVCSICGCIPLNRKNTHVDHDHFTGQIRGILCQRCNTMLGKWEQKRTFVLEYLKGARYWKVRSSKWIQPDLDKFFNDQHSNNTNCWSCAASSIKNRLSVDHDHKTLEIRGILCIACNSSLGWYEKFQDQVDLYLGEKL